MESPTFDTEVLLHYADGTQEIRWIEGITWSTEMLVLERHSRPVILHRAGLSDTGRWKFIQDSSYLSGRTTLVQ